MPFIKKYINTHTSTHFGVLDFQVEVEVYARFCTRRISIVVYNYFRKSCACIHLHFHLEI